MSISARHFNALGLALVYKAELFLHATGFFVAVVISTPDAVHAEILECIAKHLARGFGNEPLPPKGFADPITKLVFIVCFSKIVAMKADTTNGLAVLFQTHGKGIGSG